MDQFDYVNATKDKLKDFMVSNFPEVRLNGQMNRNTLISLCASKIKTKFELESYGVLDVSPYFIMPIFVDYESQLKVSDNEESDDGEVNDTSRSVFEKEKSKRVVEFQNSLKETMNFFKKLDFKVIRNNKSVPPEDEENLMSPKRWQSLPLDATSPTKLKKLPKLLQNVISSLSSIGRKLNPMFELSDLRILKSDPGLAAQFVHGDNTSYVDSISGKEKTNAMVVSGIVAFEDNTLLDIAYGKQLTSVLVERGHTIVFKASQAHRGSSNITPNEQYRLHYTLKKHEMKLIDNNLVFVDPCNFCGGYYRSSTIGSHRRSCKANPNSESRRRKLCTYAKHHRENKRKKMSTEPKDTETSGLSST